MTIGDGREQNDELLSYCEPALSVLHVCARACYMYVFCVCVVGVEACPP